MSWQEPQTDMDRSRFILRLCIEPEHSLKSDFEREEIASLFSLIDDVLLLCVGFNDSDNDKSSTPPSALRHSLFSDFDNNDGK